MSAVSGANRQRPITLQEFADHGLLWMVNASVFHPRGLALQIDDREPDKLTVIATVPAEPILYSEQMEEFIRGRFEAFEAFVEEMRT